MLAHPAHSKRYHTGAIGRKSGRNAVLWLLVPAAARTREVVLTEARDERPARDTEELGGLVDLDEVADSPGHILAGQNEGKTDLVGRRIRVAAPQQRRCARHDCGCLRRSRATEQSVSGNGRRIVGIDE